MAREILKAAKSAYQRNKDNRKLGSYGLTLRIKLNLGLKDIASGNVAEEAIEDLSYALRLAKTYDNTCCKGKYKNEINKGIVNLAYLRCRGELRKGVLDEIKLSVAIHEEQLLAMSVAGFIQTLSISEKTKENHV